MASFFIGILIIFLFVIKVVLSSIVSKNKNTSYFIMLAISYFYLTQIQQRFQDQNKQMLITIPQLSLQINTLPVKFIWKLE